MRTASETTTDLETMQLCLDHGEAVFDLTTWKHKIDKLEQVLMELAHTSGKRGPSGRLTKRLSALRGRPHLRKELGELIEDALDLSRRADEEATRTRENRRDTRPAQGKRGDPRADCE